MPNSPESCGLTKRIFLGVLLCWLVGLPLRAMAQESAPLEILTENLAPYNYLDRGRLKGVCAEVVLELIRRTDTSIDSGIRVLPWSRAYAIAQENRPVALFCTARSPQRESLFQWVGPIFHSRVALFKRKGNPASVTSLEDAKRYTIGVLQNYQAHLFLQEQKFPHIYVIPGTPEQMISLLDTGRVDLWAQTWATAMFYAKRTLSPDFQLEEVYPSLFESDIYVAFSLATPQETVQQWNRALNGMRQDGTYDTIVKRFRYSLSSD